MCEVNLDGLRPFDQWELLDCNGHGPSVLCVKGPLLNLSLRAPIQIVIQLAFVAAAITSRIALEDMQDSGMAGH